MKKLTFLSFTFIAILAMSCKKDTPSGATQAQIIVSQKAIITSGNWKISLFIENGMDMTSQYNALVFHFDSNGSSVSDSAGIHFQGDWDVKPGSKSLTDDSGNHSAGEDNNKFSLALTGNKLLDEISEDWTIIQITDTEIWLRDDNLISPKEIHFSKI
jgi:hypothetical protein